HHHLRSTIITAPTAAAVPAPPSPSSLSLGERGRRRWSPPPPLFSLTVVDCGDDESRRLLLSLSGVGCFSEVG
ncbi:hypothetical protein LINGRAPRIM_LOCUS97, partial [Linum grandiflorum]